MPLERVYLMIPVEIKERLDELAKSFNGNLTQTVIELIKFGYENREEFIHSKD